jgi:hypothetical protein
MLKLVQVAVRLWTLVSVVLNLRDLLAVLHLFHAKIKNVITSFW